MAKALYPVFMFLVVVSCSRLPSALVAVKAELVGYRSNALYLEYSDKTGEWFDAATFRITSPSALRGREVVVHYGKGTERPFGMLGGRFEFSIDRVAINAGSRPIFYAELKYLKRVE